MFLTWLCFSRCDELGIFFQRPRFYTLGFTQHSFCRTSTFRCTLLNILTDCLSTKIKKKKQSLNVLSLVSEFFWFTANALFSVFAGFFHVWRCFIPWRHRFSLVQTDEVTCTCINEIAVHGFLPNSLNFAISNYANTHTTARNNEKVV